MLKIVCVGDYSENVVAHRAIPKAIALASGKGPIGKVNWLATAMITSERVIAERSPDAIWCVPGSPYENMEGALRAIQYAREKGIPFLGTCGGFQHAIIEYARNVLGIAEADHLESNPGAATPVIAKLSCALINRSEGIELGEGSELRRIYGKAKISEEYQCSYGLNPDLRERFAGSDLRFTAFGASGEARAFELKGHPFFVGTLFQPERSAAAGKAHPLIREFLCTSLSQRSSAALTL